MVSKGEYIPSHEREASFEVYVKSTAHNVKSMEQILILIGRRVLELERFSFEERKNRSVTTMATKNRILFVIDFNGRHCHYEHHLLHAGNSYTHT